MKAFNSAKNSSIGLKSGEVWWQIYQLHTSITTHLLDPSCMMDGCIIHNKNRLRLWPFTTQRKKLLYEILKYGTICGSLEDVCEDNAVLCICWQYLISLLTLELRNLGWSHPKGAQLVRLNPMRLSQPDSSTKTYCQERICDVLYRYKSRRSAFRPFAIR